MDYGLIDNTCLKKPQNAFKIDYKAIKRLKSTKKI